MAASFAELGFAILGVTYDPPEQQARFTAQQGIAYPIYSDVGSAVIRDLGLRNETMTKGTRFYGVPWPGVFLLDADGRVLAKFAEADYRERPANETLLEAARQAAQP